MKFNYQGSNRVESYCDIEIIGNLVIATELADNPGMSITNAAEEVATSVCLRNEIPMDKLIWIEKYENFGVNYDLVQFIYNGEKLTHPHWRRLANYEVQTIRESQMRMKGDENIEQTKGQGSSD